MSASSTCAQCGAPTSAETLDGLCMACVGRGILAFEAPPGDWPDAEFGPAPGHPLSAATGSGVEQEPGGRVGAYRLIRQIGEGGFGVVYLAEQREPVKRQVALKIIKLGMDTRQVVARFEAERQALALMDHPGIAKVFDAGATETGRPYFVMEFVEGIPITDYADRQQLTISDRLGLFIKVCDAVQHAHQKGVIHRDLKPSNILVAMQDSHASSKVIDFGLAKATRVELTDKTLITHFHQLIGTPAYMSPEQIEMGAVDVDTRSDIYSLGVLLYELLTGRTPFETQELLRGGMSEAARRIREEEPPRPSTRLSQELVAADVRRLKSKSETRAPKSEEEFRASSRRLLQLKKLIPLLRGDLDWIVMKALEKDRTRRYETANALAQDIRRHLGNEPVNARPPTALYQFQKLVRRNKLAVGSAAAVLLALLVGLGVASLAWVKERQTRRYASAKAEESRQRLVHLNVVSGNQHVEQGDAHGALLWFAEALRLDEGRPAREDVHRRQFAAVMRQTPALAALSFQGGFVTMLQFSADGRRIVSASDNNMARVWEAVTGRLIATFQHPAAVEVAAFAGEERVATACRDNLLRVWDLRTAALVAEPQPFIADWGSMAVSEDGAWIIARVVGGARLFHGGTGAPEGPVLASSSALRRVYFSPDGQRVAGASADHVIQFWEVPSGRLLPTAITIGVEVRQITFSPDGQHVAVISGGTRQDVTVWNVATGARTLRLPKRGGDLMDSRFSPDGRWLAIASWDGAARIFDSSTGLPTGDAMRHGRGVGQVAFSTDNRLLATASWDDTARLWISGTGHPASPSLHHAGYVHSAIFSPDGAGLATAGQDQTIRFWDVRKRSAARLELAHQGRVVRARFSPNGRHILTCGADKLAKLWDRQSGQLLFSLAHQSPLLEGKFSADGTRIATATTDGAVQVWNATTGEPLATVARHPGRLKAMDFSLDGNRLATAGDDGKARVWHAGTGELLVPALEHNAEVLHVAFSPDARLVVTASADQTAQVWEVATGQRVGGALRHVCEVVHAAFSPDGTQVVTAPSDRTQWGRAAQVWSVAHSQPVGTPLPHKDGVLFAEFSPDSRWIVTTGEDSAAVVWDARTGVAHTRPLRHESYVLRAAFSADSRLLLTVGHDNMARVWDVEDGEAVTPPLLHDGEVSFGAWSPDGLEIVTASYDGRARVWEVAPATASLAELQRQAELLSAHRLEANLGPVPLSVEEMKRRWEERKGR